MKIYIELKTVVLMLMIIFINNSAHAFVTVGLVGDGCDYNNLMDAYNDNDPILHITTQLTFSDTFDITKPKSFIGGHNNCSDAENGIIGQNKTIWRKFDDETVINIITNQVAQSLIVISNFEIFGGHNLLDLFAPVGGIRILGNSSVQINNSDIHDNSGDLGGGIFIFGNETSLEINFSQIRDNTANSGGGIYCSNDAEIIIQNESAINSNIVQFAGGGIYASTDCQITLNSGDTLPINQMQEGIFNNTAKSMGGGIYANSGTDVFLTGNNLHPASVSNNGNTIFGVNHIGGGIFATGAGTNITAINARIDSNYSANYGGGVAVFDLANFQMDRLDEECWDNDKCSSLSNNIVTLAGGNSGAGSFYNSATAQISQTYISGNFAELTSVFSIGNNANVRMEGNLLTNNSLSNPPFNSELFTLTGFAGNGGHLDFFYNTVADNNINNVFKLLGEDSQQTLKVSQSIIIEQGDILLTTGSIQPVTTFDCLIVHENQSLMGNIFQALILNPVFVNQQNGDYHLSASSPAIDFCDESFTQSQHNDLNGKTRGIDDPSTQNFIGTYDLGAYVYQLNAAIFSNGFE